MLKQFEKLTKEEAELLFKAPVLVSVLAASGNHEINSAEKADAIKLAHIKTFTADPLLLSYYNEVEEKFNNYFEVLEKKYAPFDDAKRDALKAEINKLNVIFAKLEKNFAQTLHKSLTNYANHVRRADRAILEDFIFPVPIPGLTD